MRAERLALAGCLALAGLSACQRAEPPAPPTTASAAPTARAASTTPAPDAPASTPAPSASAAPPPPSASASAAASTGSAALPADVLAFQARRDQCDHFRGEEAYDAKRAAFLAAALKRYCRGSDHALAQLRQRHAGNAAVQAALKDYDDHIE